MKFRFQWEFISIYFRKDLINGSISSTRNSREILGKARETDKVRIQEIAKISEPEVERERGKIKRGEIVQWPWAC